MTDRELHDGFFIQAVLAGLIAILVLLSLVLVRQYENFNETSGLHAHPGLFLHRQTGPLSNPSFVQAWMTFDYVDRLYALPSGYLQDKLSITDARYPRLTISAWSHDTGETLTEAVTSVQEAVAASLAASH